jgi:hypothetical protein
MTDDDLARLSGRGPPEGYADWFRCAAEQEMPDDRGWFTFPMEALEVMLPRMTDAEKKQLVKLYDSLSRSKPMHLLEDNVESHAVVSVFERSGDLIVMDTELGICHLLCCGFYMGCTDHQKLMHFGGDMEGKVVLLFTTREHALRSIKECYEYVGTKYTRAAEILKDVELPDHAWSLAVMLIQKPFFA